MSTRQPLDAQAKTEAAVLLLGAAATNHDLKAVTRVALSAGFMWRCHPCKADHYLTVGACACGARRPDGLA
jgi:hypothetical protein